MSKSAAHLQLVASNDEEFDRKAAARRFRDAMAEHLRGHTEGTNINPGTLLATDYLNHFNEAIMLLEMLPAAPAELAADLAAWRHETYEEHFHRSGFRDKRLAITAYRNAPSNVRHALDTVTDSLTGKLAGLLAQVQRGLDTGDTKAVTALCAEAVPALHAQLEVASAIINGEIQPVDRIVAEASANAGDHQDAVDKLFE